MPIRSTGCLTCRKRKIRCDESRPGCERCATHGVPCPGYRADQPAGIEFKDQTNITAKRAELRYKARAGGTKPKAVSGGSDGGSTSGDDDDSLTDQMKLLIVAQNKASAAPARLLSPVAERAQLYQEFITSYFPKRRYGDQSGYFNFFQTIVLKRSSQPALEKGLDTLSLVQLGSLYKDRRLLKAAGARYVDSLRSLANAIAKGDYMHDDDVLAAVSTLAICELFEEIANMGEGWAKHVQGSNVLFAARGPESFTSGLAFLLYTNVRHGSLLWALITRKMPFLAAPEWREIAMQDAKAVQNDPEISFYDIALQVPGMLQRHDEIDLAAPTALSDVDRVLHESMELEMKLRSWWSDWQDTATVDNMIDCELRPIEDFPTFASQVADRTFDHAYLFPDFQTAYVYSLYWMVMHHLRTAVQSLHKMRHALVVDWYPETLEMVPEDELLGYILNLCQCIPFFVEPISCSAGHIGVFLPMRTAAFYFTDHGHWGWLKWVGAVRNGVFTKGLSPPVVPGRTIGIPQNASR